MRKTRGGYEWLITEDGSPSFKQGEDGEWMHSSGGAYTETQYIYGEAVRRTLSLNLRAFLSLGLGLGYNELLILAEATQRGAPVSELRITSFEADAVLSESFLNWLQLRHTSGSIPAELEIYEMVLKSFEKTYGEAVCGQLPGALWKLHQQGMWRIDGPLVSDTDFDPLYNCVLYDAFSSKSSPELWSEDFLNRFLSEACDEACIFSTYACTGALKRALLKNDFELVIRKGFHVKKESTYAERL